MAHEVRNALVAGKTFIDLLLEKNQDAELATLVRREMGRIDRIVGQMLKFASPAKPSFSPIHLHEALNQCVRLLEPQLRSKAINLNRSYAAVPDLISGDEFQLQQAFVNLLLNAVEAMGPEGKLSLSTDLCSAPAPLDQPTPPRVRITIADSGIGIPAENMSRLFEPFFTTKPNGTGLGLPITRRIIQEHSGEISVASDGAQGASFNIVLPSLQPAH
jgi:signal transduction histidine kinase